MHSRSRPRTRRGMASDAAIAAARAAAQEPGVALMAKTRRTGRRVAPPSTDGAAQEATAASAAAHEAIPTTVAAAGAASVISSHELALEAAELRQQLETAKTENSELRRRLGCQSFRWYLREVHPDHPPLPAGFRWRTAAGDERM